MVIFGILLVVAVIITIVIASHFKKLRYGNLVLITGGVKTGKTQLSVALAVKQYRKQLAKWRRTCRKARRRYEPLPEKPLLYSNMPIGRVGTDTPRLPLNW